MLKLCLLLCTIAAAGTFPPEVTVAGKKLVLNGTGLRQYSIFKVNVYEGALYLEKRSTDDKAILASPETKQVRMRFFRAAPGKDAADGWRDYLKENWEGDWSRIAATAERYLALLPDVKENEEMVHDFIGDKVVIYLGERKVGEVTGRDFMRTLLSTWIGKKPSTEDLKRGLLGVKD